MTTTRTYLANPQSAAALIALLDERDIVATAIPDSLSALAAVDVYAENVGCVSCYQASDGLTPDGPMCKACANSTNLPYFTHVRIAPRRTQSAQ